MISGENLTFCAADSNMYIGRIHPLIYCSSFFFPHSAFNFRNSHPCINLHFYRISLIYAWRAETVVLKNVRMFTCQVYWKRWSSNHAFTMPLKREERVERKQEKRRAEMVEAGSGDERGQKKAKTMRKMIEVRKPGGGGEDGCLKFAERCSLSLLNCIKN